MDNIVKLLAAVGPGHPHASRAAAARPGSGPECAPDGLHRVRQRRDRLPGPGAPGRQPEGGRPSSYIVLPSSVTQQRRCTRTSETGIEGDAVVSCVCVCLHPACLQMHLASWQEKRMVIIMKNIKVMSFRQVPEGSSTSGEGTDGALASMQSHLAAGRLAEAADALEAGTKGTAAEKSASEWARDARARALADQTTALLQAHACSLAVSQS